MAQAGAGSIEFIGKVQLDASELMKVLGMGGGGKVTAGGGTPVSGGGSEEEQAKTIQKGMRKAHKDPSFMSIFRPLVALEGLKALVMNSRVANTYLGAMGKMFSAAIDLLLLPFTPIFNLLMVGMAKLIGWLIDSGVLEWIGKGVEDMLGVLKDIWGVVKTIGGFLGKIGKSIWDALPEPIRKGLESIGKVIAKVGGVLTAAAGTAGVAQLGMGAIGLGALGPLSLGKRLLGGIFGRGAAGAAAGGIAGGEQAAAGAAGAGMMGRRGMPWGRMLGGGAMMAGGLGLGMIGGQQGGAVGTASRIGGMGLMGAGLGTMFAPGVGTAIGGAAGLGIGAIDQTLLGGKIGGMLGMGGGKGGGGGGGKTADKIINIGTQNNSFNIKVEDPKQVKEIYDQQTEKMVQTAAEG